MDHIIRYLKVRKMPRHSNGTMLIALTGQQDRTRTASHAALKIEEGLGARTFAQNEPDDFYEFSRLGPMSDGNTEENTINIRWPIITFSEAGTSRDPGIIIVTGQQPNIRARAWRTLLGQTARMCRVRQLIQLAAPTAPQPHTAPPEFVGFSTDQELARKLGVHGTSQPGMGLDDPMILEACLLEGIQYAVVGTLTPDYIVANPNPMAALLLAEHVTSALQIPANLESLRQEAQALSQGIATAMEHNIPTQKHVQHLEEQRMKRLEGLGHMDPRALTQDIDEFFRNRSQQLQPPAEE